MDVMRMRFKEVSWQFMKYCQVGALGGAVSYGVFALLYKLGVHYLAASVLGYAVYMALAYVLNHKWTFGSEHHAVGGYVGMAVASLLATTLALHVLVENVGFSPLVASLLVMGLSTLGNFVGLKYLLRTR